MALTKILYSKREAADALGISTRKLDYLAVEGRIAATRIDRSVKFMEQAIRDFVEREQEKTPATV